MQKNEGKFDDTDICIVLIVDDEATIKKVITTECSIELHAYNPYCQKELENLV